MIHAVTVLLSNEHNLKCPKSVYKLAAMKKLKRPKKREKRVMYFWTLENLLPENVSYLKSLSKHSDFAIGNIRIGVFHGTFDDEDEILFPGTPERRLRKLAKDSPYQVHIMGHSHVPYYKIVDGDETPCTSSLV